MNSTRPLISFFHPNKDGSGSGSALRIEIHPSTSPTEYGSISFTIAPQKCLSPFHPFPIFDWDSAATVRFSPLEIGQILQVLKGHTESLTLTSAPAPDTSATFRLSHSYNPPLFLLKLSLSRPSNPSPILLSFSLTPPEVHSLSLSLQESISALVFGFYDPPSWGKEEGGL